MQHPQKMDFSTDDLYKKRSSKEVFTDYTIGCICVYLTLGKKVELSEIKFVLSTKTVYEKPSPYFFFI